MNVWIGGLRRAGVLGMNRRNIDYVLAENPRRYYPRVDDKLQTKRLAQAAGIPVPPLYGVIEIQRQVRELSRLVAHHAEFVIKPANGSGGNGIVVIEAHQRAQYRKVNGEWVSEHQLHHHLSNILSGMYSLGGVADQAMLEYRVRFDTVFANITFQGVPDIRIILFRGVPVMAMLRLPTRQSGGRANLHQGAIGAGVDMASGVTMNAVQVNRIVRTHPDTGATLAGVSVPYWETLLLTAARCYELTGMGYIGADFVLDHELGPLLLELNARPGLNIQIANASGLLQRLHRVSTSAIWQQTPAARVEYAQQHFSAAV